MGVCVICKNLEKIEIFYNGCKLEGCHCLAGKYDDGNLPGYYSLTMVIKQAKIIKEIQENCDSWDDSLKGKNSQQ